MTVWNPDKIQFEEESASRKDYGDMVVKETTFWVLDHEMSEEMAESLYEELGNFLGKNNGN